MRLESGSGSSKHLSERSCELGSQDLAFAQKILHAGAHDDAPVSNKSAKLEWEFYRKRHQADEHSDTLGDIAEAAVLSILDHEKSPLHALAGITVSIEAASREDDIQNGFDGMLKVGSREGVLAEIRYDATTNPAAVAKKMDEAIFNPRDPFHTTVVLGFDVLSSDSPWGDVKRGSFAAPSFLLLLKEMELQLKVHEAFARKVGDAARMGRCQAELLFVKFMLQRTPHAMSKTLLHDKVWVAIEEAARSASAVDPQSFRVGKFKAT